MNSQHPRAVATEMANEIRAADADDPAEAALKPITGGVKEEP